MAETTNKDFQPTCSYRCTYYINRELSWLKFNLETESLLAVKFLSIFFDEFFMTRQLTGGVVPTADSSRD